MSDRSLAANTGLGAAWVIVCNHLLRRPRALEWCEVRTAENELHGYICQDCDTKGINNLTTADLEPVSVDSVKHLRKARQ